MTWVITWIVDCGDGVPVPESDLLRHSQHASSPMTDPNKSANQGLSLNHQESDVEIPLEFLANISGGKNTTPSHKGMKNDPWKIIKSKSFKNYSGWNAWIWYQKRDKDRKN